MTVISAEMPHMAGVSVGLWVGVGGRYEPVELGGVCHFIEHLLFKGTRTRTARQISQAVEGIGGYLNAFTGEESTCFHARAGHPHLETLLEVLVDMLTRSRFDPEDIDKERNVIKEELAMYLDQPHHQVQELLNASLWPDQPLGRPLTGTPESLDRIRRPEMLAFYERCYVAPAIVITAAGRLTHSHLVRAVRARADAFRAGSRPVSAPAVVPRERLVIRGLRKPTEQTQIALGMRTCSRHDPRRYSLRLLSTLLGENMSSRLFQSLREDTGLAYSVYSALSYFEDTGALTISAGLDTRRLGQALSLISRELRRLRERSPGATEFGQARDYVLGQMDLSLESTDNQMFWLGEQWLGYRRLAPPDLVRRRLGRVRPADVRAAARDFAHPDRFCLALVTPRAEVRTLRRHLRP